MLAFPTRFVHITARFYQIMVVDSHMLGPNVYTLAFLRICSYAIVSSNYNTPLIV